MRRKHLIICVCLLLSCSTVWGQSLHDSNLWLEDITGEKPLNWVKTRNAATVSELAETDQFHALKLRLRGILDSNKKIPYVQKIGDLYYNFWRDAKNPRGLWRRTTLQEFRKNKPDWEVVIDLDILAEAEDENWFWKDVLVLEPNTWRCIVSLSRGGADAVVKREFDLETKQFVDGGYSLPEAKSFFGWRGRDSAFVGTDFGPESLTNSGYPRIVKEWARGTPLEEAVIVFEGQPEDNLVSAYRDLTPGFERDIFKRQPSFYTSELYIRRDGQLIRIEVPDDAKTSIQYQWLFVEPHTDWQISNVVYPAGALLAINFEAFLQGERGFDVLFEPSERKSLAEFSLTPNFVLLTVMDNVRNKLYILTPPLENGGAWTREEVPSVPEQVTARIRAVDFLDTDDYFLTFDGYLSPTTLSFGTVGKGPAETLKTNPAFFNAQGLKVTQHEAISKDGTKIPYVQVAREDLPHDGTNPVILYGYGGFAVPLRPHYNPSVGAAWLEKGGVYVVANIRGGGEFGPKWHQAALKSNRHKAYEDFIAVAEDLVLHKVTTPANLGILGGSNGGLLMGNMLTMRPDLFGAIVGIVPLLDMSRFHSLFGAMWMDEYGNPDLPEEWEFIKTFSPYHNVKPNVIYPRTLFTTSTRDDRVHPGHARKMVARMIKQGHDVLYYENTDGGHSWGANNEQRAFMTALSYMFFGKTLRSSLRR